MLRCVSLFSACARVSRVRVSLPLKYEFMSIFSLEASAERVFRLVEIILGVLSSLLAVLRKSFKEFNDDDDDTESSN